MRNTRGVHILARAWSAAGTHWSKDTLGEPLCPLRLDAAQRAVGENFLRTPLYLPIPFSERKMCRKKKRIIL
jgi:hypothetical protein